MVDNSGQNVYHVLVSKLNYEALKLETISKFKCSSSFHRISNPLKQDKPYKKEHHDRKDRSPLVATEGKRASPEDKGPDDGRRLSTKSVETEHLGLFSPWQKSGHKSTTGGLDNT